MSSLRICDHESTLPLVSRALGRTASMVSILTLGGEGILRTHGRMKEAAAIIEHALCRGFTAFDTAPAWASSESYLGATLGGHRDSVFLASKTHDRTRDGSWRLLDESLRRLKTDVLDLWQIQDVRTRSQVKQILSSCGAAAACREAWEQGIVRSIGVTGHSDPDVLAELLAGFDADVVTSPVNAAECHLLSFHRMIQPIAAQQHCGMIARHVTTDGRSISLGVSNLAEALGYALSQPSINTVIVDCETPEDIDLHYLAVQDFHPFSIPMLRSLEERTKRHSRLLTFYRERQSTSAVFNDGSEHQQQDSPATGSIHE